MRNRGLLLLLVLLLLILLLEGLAIAGTFDQYLYRPTPATPTMPSAPSNEPSTQPEPSTPPPSGSLSGTRVYDVTSAGAAPGFSATNEYRETQLLTATPSADGRSISVQGSDTQSPANRSIARLQVETDGSYFLTFFETSDEQGSFSCEGSVPGYLAVGRSSAPASLNCSIDGQPLTSFTGTATAGPAAAYTFQGKTYQARTTTVEGSFGITGGTPQGLEFVSAPGIGTLEIHGSMGDLVFGALLGPVASESRSVLVESDNDALFLPS